jgi:predicted phosphoribosyltransferase
MTIARHPLVKPSLEGYAKHMRPYRDRAEAGELLGAVLARHLGPDPLLPPVVLALPRGGVVVGAGVADALGSPLDVLLVRKLGVPGTPELAMGALATVSGARGGEDRPVTAYIDEDLVRRLGIDAASVERIRAAEEAELLRRAEAYRGGRPPPAVTGVLPILVDDGLATGSTMRAALSAVRAAGAGQVIVAVPVGAPASLDDLSREADVVSLLAPPSFSAVGAWYEHFPQVSDDEVQQLLSGVLTPRAG